MRRHGMAFLAAMAMGGLGLAAGAAEGQEGQEGLEEQDAASCKPQARWRGGGTCFHKDTVEYLCKNLSTCKRSSKRSSKVARSQSHQALSRRRETV